MNGNTFYFLLCLKKISVRLQNEWLIIFEIDLTAFTMGNARGAVLLNFVIYISCNKYVPKTVSAPHVR